MKIPKVNILLSTYNGEQYIVEQLDSLLAQSYPNIEIFIRDDGSSDSTVSIINHYIKFHPEKKISFLFPPSSENSGYQKSFWKLLRECPEADYYAFCDQDDIWLPDKVARGVRSLEEKSSSLPLLYTSSFAYYDNQLNYSGSAPKVNTPIMLKDVLFYTPAFGFTIMINNQLRALAKTFPENLTIPHDNWCLKAAASLGEIIYDPSVTAKYRRHRKTTTFSDSSLLKMTMQWIKTELFGNEFHKMYDYNQKFLSVHGSLLPTAEYQILNLFSSNSFSGWFKRLFYPYRLRPSLGGELALRICFFLNK